VGYAPASLRAQLARGANLSMHDRLNVLRDVARALAYAHGEGVIHRDIKPDNILLSGGAAVVTDFGIAKAISASRTIDSAAPRDDNGTLTQVGSSIGTPAYMAPEQAVGESIDARADLYAWGVVAYELLSGAHPFAGKTGASQLIAAHIAETPHTLAELAPSVSRYVSALVMQCLAKSPSERPADANAILARLSTITTPSTDSTPSSSPLPPSPPRPPFYAVAVSVAALTLVGASLRAMRRASTGTAATGTAATASTAADSSPVRSLVVLPFESVGGDTANAYFAEGMADELSNALGKVPGLQLAGRSSAAAFLGKQKSAQEIGAALNVGGVLEGTVRRAGGKVRVFTQLTNARTGLVLWNDSFERSAQDVFAVQDDIAQAIVAALRVTLVGGTANDHSTARGTENLDAYNLYQHGMYFYQRRGPGLGRAREYFEQAIAKDPNFARARAHAALGLGWIASAVYTDVAMTDARPKALASGERAVALDSALADGWATIGITRTYQYRWREADDATQRAVRLDGRNIFSHLYRARFLLATGRTDDAAAEAQQAAALEPVKPLTLGVASLALSIAGRHAEAIAAGNRAWEIDSMLSGSSNYFMYALLGGAQVAEAKRRAQVVLSSSTEVGALAGAVYTIGVAGDTARAANLAQQLALRYTASPRINVALIGSWLGAGDRSQALTAMERAAARFEIGVVNVPFSHRRYDPVRASPRFAAIVRSLGLDVALFTSPNGGRPR